MPDVTIGALTFEVTGNDAPLRTVLAKYANNNQRVITVDLRANGASAANTALVQITANAEKARLKFAELATGSPITVSALVQQGTAVRALAGDYTALTAAIKATGLSVSPASQQRAAGMNTEAQAARMLKQEVNTLRNFWQAERVTEAETVAGMQKFNAAAAGQLTSLEAQITALKGLDVLNVAETKQLAELIALQNSYGVALKGTASTINTVNGVITRGSLAAGVKLGVNDLSVALKGLTEQTTLLVNQEKAGIITKKELVAGLAQQVAAQRSTLAAIEAEAAATRNLGLVQVGNVERLTQLRTAQGEYTAALAQTIAAQERSAGMSAKGALMGGAGLKAGLNDAGMALSFISPQAGLIGMAASMGPVVAGAAAIGLGLGAIVKLTKDGQTEAKALQQAYLTMAANGGNDIGKINTALNEMIAHGTAAEMMFSKSELAGALAELAKGGVKGADGLMVLKTSANLAAAEHIKLGDATKELYNNLQHLGLNFDQAASFGDKLARATHLTTNSMDSFSKGMNVVGATAKTLGFSVDETLAMLVKLAQKGMDPATIGATGLRNMLQKLETPSKQTQADFASMGIAMQDANGHFRSGHDIFVDLQKVMSETGPIYSKTTGHLLTSTDLIKMAFSEFGTRSATAFEGLKGDLRTTTTEIQKSQGFLQTYTDIVTNGLSGAQSRLDAATKNLSLTFAQIFTPALTAVVKILQSGVTDMNDFVTGLSNASQGVDKFATIKISEDDSPFLKFLKFVNNLISDTGIGLDGLAKKMDDLANLTGLKKLNDMIVSFAPGLGGAASQNEVGQQHAKQLIGSTTQGISAVQDQLKRAQGAGDTHAVAKLTDTLAGLQADLKGYQADLKKLQNTSGIGGGFAAGPGILPLKTGDKLADTLVDECSRWVRISLEKANPQLTGALSKLFGGTADISKNNFKAAGLLHPFTGLGDLKPGDTVFYDNNHVGVYIGNGMVRGNNRLSNTASGGKDPVGDNYIGSLGSIAGYARLSELAQKMGLDPAKVTGGTLVKASVTTPPEMDPNFKGSSVTSLKALKDEMLRLTAAYKSGKMDVDAYHNAVQGVLSQAEALAATQNTGSKEWTATEQLVIKASNALRVHTKATEQSALTWAQWLKNRSAATALAQRESDLSDGKLSPQAAIQTKADLQSYRNDPVKALALEEASRQLAASVKRREDAQAAADQSKKDADAQAKQAQRDAEKAAADHDKAVKDQAKAAAETMKALREDDVKAAKASLDHLKELQDQALANDKDNVVKLLATKTQYAKDVFALQHEINLAEYNQSVREANNGRAQERPKLLATAQTTFDTAELAAKNAQGDTTRTATDAVTSAVQKQRDAYSKLADSMRGMVKDGSLTADSLQSWLQEFNTLGRETATLGLTNDKYVEGARKATFALKDQGIAAQGAAVLARALAGEFKDVQDGGRRVTEGYVLSIKEAVAQIPLGTDAGAKYVKMLQDMEATGHLAAGAIDAVTKAMDLQAQRIQAMIDMTLADPSLARGQTDPNNPVAMANRGLGFNMPTPMGTADALGKRTAPKLNPDGTPYVDPGVGARTGDTTVRDAAYAAFQTTEAQDAYKKSLEGLTVAELQNAEATARRLKDAVRLPLILSQIDTATKKLAQDQQTADQAANTHAANMLALGRSNAAADLAFQHSQGGISDRGFITAEQAQAEQAAMDKYKAAFNTAGSDMVLAWEQYQADMTAASRKGLTDRMALDKAGLDSFIQGIDSLGSALGGLQTVAGTALTAVGGALKLGQQFKDLQAQNASAFGSGGSIFDKLGAIGSDLGFVGAAIGLVGQLGDAIMNLSPAYQAAKKAALELAAAEQQAMGSKNYGGKSILNPYYDKLKADADALTTKANAGFWQQLGWAIFGGAPKTLDKAAADALTVAGQTFNDFASTLYGSLESALMNAFDSGDFSGVAAAVEKSLNQLVAKMYLQTLIAKSTISKDLQTLADDQSNGKSITADVARIKTDSASIVSQFQAGSTALPGFGAGAAGGTAGPSNIIGAGPSQVFGAAQITFSPEALASFSHVFDPPIAAFGGHIDRFGGLVTRLELLESRGGSQRSGLSGLSS
ncbi:phage tail tape measure protein (plasmid) [Deinococcus radiomollis]|uniref:phage tail tape measure protein n=1 Tax=Deinococcus radiomollis TaxID=468916 RepID=UPI0038915E0B